MSYSIYEASVPVARDIVASLASILKKGEASPKAASLAETKLVDDMLPLGFQVHMITDVAEKIVARLSGVAPADNDRNITTFEQYHARIAKAEKALAGADKDLINKRMNETVPVGMGPGKTVNMTGIQYLNGYALPNLFFHLTAAYMILRKEGVDIGKMDYLTPFVGKYVS